MKAWSWILAVVFAVLPAGGAASAQVFFPQKDLVFTHLAAGGGYETILTLTNRGTYTYTGKMYFYKNCGEAWNPTVNGSAITGGWFTASLPPGDTVTYRVSGANLEAGFCYLYSDDMVLDNFVEGNQTYYVLSGLTVQDSIGISPSTELLISTVPFESFSTIAVAFANPDFYWSRTASITLRLYDSAGTFLTSANVSLAPLCHYPRFLSDIFPGYNPGRGRLDIQSDNPIVAAALTLNGGQLSSLPMIPSPTTYDMTAVDVGGITTRGEAASWIEGRFVKGYLRVIEFNGTAMDYVFPIAGRFVNGSLRMSFYGSGPAFNNEEATIYFYIPSFSLATSSFTVEYVETFLAGPSTSYGTLYLTKNF